MISSSVDDEIFTERNINHFVDALFSWLVNLRETLRFFLHSIMWLTSWQLASLAAACSCQLFVFSTTYFVELSCWDVVFPSNSQWAHIFLKMVHFLILNFDMFSIFCCDSNIIIVFSFIHSHYLNGAQTDAVHRCNRAQCSLGDRLLTCHRATSPSNLWLMFCFFTFRSSLGWEKIKHYFFNVSWVWCWESHTCIFLHSYVGCLKYEPQWRVHGSQALDQSGSTCYVWLLMVSEE